MDEVTITELRRNLTACLARLQRGARISVTWRGKVVAELAPPASPPAVIAAARARLRGSVRRYARPFDAVFDAEESNIRR